MKQIIHLKGLNGLRAIAAISVMLSHVFQNTFGNWGITPIHLSLFEGGVTLFFVISGFLITFLLLKEKKLTNSINIKKFYLRRILRIWPLYYMFILVCIIIVSQMKAESILVPTLWYYLFFTANIPFLSASGIWIIVHYWSIGVEEQYYLFWPWVVKYAKSNLIKVTIVLLILFFGCKIGSWVLFSNHSLIYRFFAVTSFHCMMLGGIGAILYYKRTKWFLLITTDKRIQLLTWIALVLSGFYAEFIPALIRNEYTAFISLLLIMGQVENKTTLLKLENKTFNYIGKISYGIYVIHPLIIYLLSIFWRFKLSHSMPIAIQYPLIYSLVCTLTIIVAALSYKFYESPFLYFKERFAIIKSSGSCFLK